MSNDERKLGTLPSAIRFPRRSVLGGGLALLAGFAPFRSAQSASTARLWGRWLANDPTSRVVIDHQSWGTFLRRYLVEEPDGINRLKYGEVSEGDRQALEGYLKGLCRIVVQSLNAKEQFAYWINLYNALTVKVVLDHYPVKSIRTISLGGSLIPDFVTGGSGPWQAKLTRIDGEALSLDDIEHGILRPIFKDNRVHYAVNCASIGCPTLMPEPFTATAFESMLDQSARLYVNHPRGVKAEGRGLTVSSIYRWFMEDFGGSWQGVLDHLRRFANASTLQLLANAVTVSGDTYDWSLNDAATYKGVAQARER
jgi:hypothetical protein